MMTGIQTIEERRRSWAAAHPVLTGAAAGLAWGILMRSWMRFISTHPEFTWSGTGFILGAATTAGMGLGLAWRLRRRESGQGWRLAGTPVVLLGMGAGMIMLPAAFLGGLALARRSWPAVARGLLVAAGLAAQFPLLAEVDVGSMRSLVALVWYLAMLGIEAAGFSILFLPGRREPPTSDPQARSIAPPKRRSRR